MQLLGYDLSTDNLSHAQLAVIVAGLLFVFLVIEYRDRAIGTRRRPDLRTLPGSLPLVGNLFWVLKNNPNILESWASGQLDAQRDGDKRPVSFTLPFMRVIDATNPKAYEYIQKTAFQNFGKGTSALVSRALSRAPGSSRQDSILTDCAINRIYTSKYDA